jgi:CBS-domain-containing membrane protein
MSYSIICIYASEDARWQGKPLPEALMHLLGQSGLPARCLVTKAIAGSYEDGEMASARVEVLSFNMPLKIEIVLPSPEVAELLPRVTEMVGQGIVGITEMRMVSHKVRQHLIPRHLMVRDVMTPDPQRALADWPLSQALAVLLSHDFSGLPVVDQQDHPVGMLTDGDLVYRAGIPLRVRLMSQFSDQEIGPLKQSLVGQPVSGIMTSPVVTVRRDQHLSEAVDAMLQHGLRRLPVVDDDGVLQGILSRVDIFKAISQHAPDSRDLARKGIAIANPRRAGDIMLKNIPTVAPDTPLKQVIELLGNSAVERVAVLDPEGRLLGLISDQAMLGAFSEHKEGLWAYLMRKISPPDDDHRHSEMIRHYRATQAGQVMDRDFASVNEDTPLEEAARLLTEKRIKRLPVLDPRGRLRGMLSREALLRLGAVETRPGQA